MSLERLVVTPRDQGSGGRRIVGIAVVIALHVALVAALMMGLGQRAIEVLTKPLLVRIIAAPQVAIPKPPPPRPPRPRQSPPRPPVHVPPREVAVQVSPPAAPAPFVPPAPPAPRPVARTAAVLDATHSCPQPEYPPIARRLEESGIVTLRFLIGVDGHVVSGRVAQSSGYKMLDDAALRALSTCRFNPGTVNGQPVQSWANLKYVWKLEE